VAVLGRRLGTTKLQLGSTLDRAKEMKTRLVLSLFLFPYGETNETVAINFELQER